MPQGIIDSYILDFSIRRFIEISRKIGLQVSGGSLFIHSRLVSRALRRLCRLISELSPAEFAQTSLIEVMDTAQIKTEFCPPGLVGVDPQIRNTC
jgi:hypothetical protein